MSSRPSYLQGRGRGRGQQVPCPPGGDRAPGQVKLRPPHSSTTSSTSDDGGTSSGPGSPVSTNHRFADIAAKHQQSVQRHLTQSSQDDDYESSSEEDDLNDEGIMSKMVKTFQNTNDGGDDILGRTQEYLLNSVKSKASVCLVCIETIRRTEAIWSCTGCHTSFHLTCLQKWVKDGVYQQTRDIDEEIDTRTIPWHCPKCRHEYSQADCPTRYFCFCLKEEDPTFDPWLVPHSCGQTCEKQLRPDCGHRCLLLCHPGPCPPCPQTVRASCYCGGQPAQTRRCGAREWTCGQPCDNDLSCDQHTCNKVCHPGDCPPCPETSEQSCQCGNKTGQQPCASPVWQCGKVCGRSLVCGHHVCERLCHSGQCGECPRSGNRSCPCGRTEFELPCTEDVPTCLETCDKLLECKAHKCTQRCHTGPCGTCRQLSQKTCRCGQRSKELPCFKEYICETKCSKMKDCGKHQCKKKCCDGQCTPCEQPCNKTLGCRSHKCASRCHRGLCYPCPLTVTISCPCSGSSVTLPCGRQRVTRPPRCSRPCKEPVDCHHAARTSHRCHGGSCPPCRQVCDKALDCQHACPAPCHTAVLVKKREQVERAGPWDPAGRVWQEKECLACPPCQLPTPVACLGGHEVVSYACAVARRACCHRVCGRMLGCGNHECQLECHTVKGAANENSAGGTCEVCEDGCGRSRPDGCSHPCLLTCHPGDCPSCMQMIRMRCHCQLIVQHVECHRWTDASDREKIKLKACPQRCPKMLPCKHQCTAFCHPGTCPSPEKCTEKVKVRCPCRNRKREFVCNEVQAGFAKVECEDSCQNKKSKALKEAEAREVALREEEEVRQREELEEFQRKMKPRKRKPRKQRTEEEQPHFLQRHRVIITATTVAVLSAIAAYFFLY